MIDREHDLSITKQTEVLKISRGSVYYLPRPVSSADLAIMRRLDQLHFEFPLSWRLSITMEAAFCVATLEDALARHGKPEIFNTDQGSQFTGSAFTGLLASNGIAISMDGKGAWRDNVFVGRLWRSVQYEEVYLQAYETVGEARHSIGRYLE